MKRSIPSIACGRRADSVPDWALLETEYLDPWLVRLGEDQ